MRNRSKQRVCRGKGGPDRLKDEPHLSGAYIRSLVKQLTSYRNHTSDGGGVCSAKKGTVPGLQSNGLDQETNTSFLENEELFSETKNSRSQTHSDCNLLGLNSFPNMNDMQENAVSGGNKVSSSSYKGGGAVVNAPRTKKQVRKRVHTTRPYQERLLDMAEARREIVAALRFHRASMGESTSTTTKQSAVIPSKPEPIKYKRTTKLHQANNRCHSCILKEGIHKPNEAIAVTSCSHLLCWACLEELLNFSSGATSGCAACSKPLRSCDVVPLRAPHALLQCNTEFQQPSIVHSHGEVPPLSSFSHETSTIQEDVGLPTAGKFTQTNNSLANHSTSIFYNSPPPPWSINTSEHSLPPLDLSWPSQLQQDPTLTLDPFSRCASSWQTMVSSNSCSSPGMDLTVHHEHPSMHVAMDDEKLAEIRSIGDQHEMEWNDTVNLVNSAWWSAFELPECQMKPYHYQVVELPGSSDVLSALALPSDGLWQDDSLVIHSYDWEQLDQKRSEGIEFGDNTSVMSEPSINTESLARPPQTHHIEETWDDTDMQSLDVPK